MRLPSALALAFLLSLPAFAAASEPDSTPASCTPNRLGNRFMLTPCSVRADVTSSISIRVAFGRESQGTALVEARSVEQTPAEALHVVCAVAQRAATCAQPISIFPAQTGEWIFTLAPTLTASSGSAPYARLDVVAS